MKCAYKLTLWPYMFTRNQSKKHNEAVYLRLFLILLSIKSARGVFLLCYIFKDKRLLKI